jgi:hypothetical protein
MIYRLLLLLVLLVFGAGVALAQDAEVSGGGGGGGGAGGMGTLNKVPLWTPDGSTLGDSLFTQSGTTTTHAGVLGVTYGTGTNNEVWGNGAAISGAGTFAENLIFGRNSVLTGGGGTQSNSLILGNNNDVTGSGIGSAGSVLTIGNGSSLNFSNANTGHTILMIGNGINAANGQFRDGIAIGNNMTHSGGGGESYIKIGNGMTLSGGINGVFIGSSGTTHNYSVVVGYGATHSGDQSVVVGRTATAAQQGTAIGNAANAGLSSTVVGAGTTASAGGIAIGSYVTASAGQLGFGLNGSNIREVFFGWQEATAENLTIHGGRTNAGTKNNHAGGDVILAGGLSYGLESTGGVPGALIFQTGDPAAAGTSATAATLTERWRISTVNTGNGGGHFVPGASDTYDIGATANYVRAGYFGVLYMFDGSIKQVEVGAADSGGVGYKLLRVAN